MQIDHTFLVSIDKYYSYMYQLLQPKFYIFFYNKKYN
jgi:hypothetical protein